MWSGQGIKQPPLGLWKCPYQFKCCLSARQPCRLAMYLSRRDMAPHRLQDGVVIRAEPYEIENMLGTMVILCDDVMQMAAKGQRIRAEQTKASLLRR